MKTIILIAVLGAASCLVGETGRGDRVAMSAMPFSQPANLPGAIPTILGTAGTPSGPLDLTRDTLKNDDGIMSGWIPLGYAIAARLTAPAACTLQAVLMYKAVRDTNRVSIGRCSLVVWSDTVANDSHRPNRRLVYTWAQESMPPHIPMGFIAFDVSSAGLAFGEGESFWVGCRTMWGTGDTFLPLLDAAGSGPDRNALNTQTLPPPAWSLSSDNDLMHRAVVAYYLRDVACTRIIAPIGTLDSGTVVTPACSVYNHGGLLASYTVRMRIGDGYDTTSLVTVHGAGSRYVTFPDWTPQSRGNAAVTCSTELVGDMQLANDRQTGSYRVRVQDAAAIEILAPGPVPDSVREDTSVAPVARVANLGTDSAAFTATMRIGSAYLVMIDTTLGPGAIDTLVFPAWSPSGTGVFPMSCSTSLAGDLVPTNNVRRDSVKVYALSGVTDADGGSASPCRYALYGGRPNPVAERTEVGYDVAGPCRVRIGLYDNQGRLVGVLVDAAERPGSYRTAWNRQDSHGRLLPAGVYFCRMQAGSFRGTKKLLLK